MSENYEILAGGGFSRDLTDEERKSLAAPCAHQPTYVPQLGNTYCETCKIWLHAGPHDVAAPSPATQHGPKCPCESCKELQAAIVATRAVAPTPQRMCTCGHSDEEHDDGRLCCTFRVGRSLFCSCNEFVEAGTVETPMRIKNWKEQVDWEREHGLREGEQNSDVSLILDAILRVALGVLDRGTPLERLAYIAESAKLAIAAKRAEMNQSDYDDGDTIPATSACDYAESDDEDGAETPTGQPERCLEDFSFNGVDFRCMRKSGHTGNHDSFAINHSIFGIQPSSDLYKAVIAEIPTKEENMSDGSSREMELGPHDTLRRIGAGEHMVLSRDPWDDGVDMLPPGGAVPQTPPDAQQLRRDVIKQFAAFVHGGLLFKGLNSEEEDKPSNVALHIAIMLMLDEEDNEELHDALQAYASAVTAQRDAEIKQLQESLIDARMAANCGGWPIGRKCAWPEEKDHEIFGPHTGMEDGTFLCEFHHFQYLLAARDKVIADLTEENTALTDVIGKALRQMEKANICESKAAILICTQNALQILGSAWLEHLKKARAESGEQGETKS